MNADPGTRAEWQNEIVSTLDQLNDMDVEAARGIRDEAKGLPRTHYVEPDVENPMSVVVLQAGDGLVIVTDIYESPDHAWAGRLDDYEILDELVEDGYLRVADA